MLKDHFELNLKFGILLVNILFINVISGIIKKETVSFFFFFIVSEQFPLFWSQPGSVSV